MNAKQQSIKVVDVKSCSNSNTNPPKLTVKQIVEKFVNPSTHRKLVQLSAFGGFKKNKG